MINYTREIQDMAMVRYNPFGMGELQNEINRLFTNMGESDSSGATAHWMPKVDIQEFEDRFQLFVDLPGVNPKEVEITLDGGVLNISGERQDLMSTSDGEVLNRRSERGQGRFYRRFILPDTIDTDNVNAKGVNGVLEISIQKQDKAQPRRIEVAA